MLVIAGSETLAINLSFLRPLELKDGVKSSKLSVSACGLPRPQVLNCSLHTACEYLITFPLMYLTLNKL